MKQKILNRSFEIIKEIMLEINPANLINAGVNDYELDSEIKAIAKMIDRINSPRDAVLITKKVFYSSFHNHFEADYDLIGNKIFEKLKENKLI